MTLSGQSMFVSPLNIDYGNININDSTSNTVTIENNGSSPLTNLQQNLVGAGYTIESVGSSCGASLNPFTSCNIIIKFTPTTSELYTGTLTVTADSQINAIVDLAGAVTANAWSTNIMTDAKSYGFTTGNLSESVFAVSAFANIDNQLYFGTARVSALRDTGQTWAYNPDAVNNKFIEKAYGPDIFASYCVNGQISCSSPSAIFSKSETEALYIGTWAGRL